MVETREHEARIEHETAVSHQSGVEKGEIRCISEDALMQGKVAAEIARSP